MFAYPFAGAHMYTLLSPVLDCRNPLLPFVKLFCPDAPNHAIVESYDHAPNDAVPNVGELVVVRS